MNYLSFYGLEREPFSNALNSRFYYNSAQHARALVRMMFAIENMKGLGVVTGPVGTGKSTTARRLLDGLPKGRFEGAILSMVQSGVSPHWLLAKVAYQLGITQPAEDRTRILGQLYRRLYTLSRDGKKAVLLIDEAQLLNSPEVMEVLRGLLSLETPEQKLITLCLFGLPNLDDNLRLDPSLHQRIAVRGRLAPLEEEEAEAYIKHRLRLAGASQMLFTREAVEAIYRVSGGVPRITNTLCDNALFEGFLTRTNPITRRLVTVVAKELGVPEGAPPLRSMAPQRQRRAPGRSPEVSAPGPLDGGVFRAGGHGPRLSPNIPGEPTPREVLPPRPRPTLGPGLRRAAAIADGGLFAESGLSWPSAGERPDPELPEREIPLFDEPEDSGPEPVEPPGPLGSGVDDGPVSTVPSGAAMASSGGDSPAPFSEDLQATQPIGGEDTYALAETQDLKSLSDDLSALGRGKGERGASEAEEASEDPATQAPSPTVEGSTTESWIDSFELTPAGSADSPEPPEPQTLEELFEGINLGERRGEGSRRVQRPMRLEEEGREGPTEPTWRRRRQAPSAKEKPSALRRLFGFGGRR